MAESKKVKVYGTPTCVFCPMVKDFLKEHGVDFEEIDVSADEQAFEEMKEKTGQMGVPVVMVGDEAVVGFDRQKLSRLLGL